MADTAQLWRLDSQQTSLIVSVDTSGSPYLLWFGDRLAEGFAGDQLLAVTEPATAKAGLDRSMPLSLFPQASSGSTAAPALSGHRNSANFAAQLKVENHTITGNTLSILMRDQVSKLAVTLTFTLDDETSVLAVTTELHNEGAAFQLDWLASATLQMPDKLDEILSLSGRWGREYQIERQRLGFNRLQIENTTGRTSHEHFPGIVLGCEKFSEQQGQLLGMHLGWSGNHRIIAERLSSGSAYVQAGIALLPGELCLAENQSWKTPAAYFCCANGLNQMSQRFHQFARKAILPQWTRSPRPIHANSWEALYFEHDENTLFGLIDAAANIGAERFVLDDGWFKGRRDDTTALGDWTVDEDVYVNGLTPIVNKVREKGMQFGLWFEPEMVSPNSDLYRRHPEWSLHVAGLDTPLARHQLVLNLALIEVQDYLFECIHRLVDEHDIDYIKWDMNRNLVLPGDGTKACAAQQPDACYALMDRLIKHRPSLEIESCSSGGARADFGVLQRTGRVWVSDNIDPIDRLRIHKGFSYFFPPEIMGSHVGHDTAHLTGRKTNLHTRALVALQGQYGFELDARALSINDQAVLREYTDLYKSNRGWLADATHWRIPTRNRALFASGIVSADQSRAQWTIIAEQSLDETCPERLVLQGLSAERLYHVRVHQPGLQALQQFGARLPAWVFEDVTLPGEILMKIGLSLPVIPAQAGLLIECVA